MGAGGEGTPLIQLVIVCVSHGLKGDTGEGNDSYKENNGSTIGAREKCSLPHTNIFFQQDVERDK